MINELKYQAIKIGDKGPAVKRVQEWLCLAGKYLKIDGQFGPITQQVLQQFQQEHSLEPIGILNEITWRLLTLPMYNATQLNTNINLTQTILAVAKQHLIAKAREIPPNTGPWVRLYMQGNEGAEWSWCCGFVSYILNQANYSFARLIPDYSFNCTDLFYNAQIKGIMTFKDGSKIRPGDLFLVERTETEFRHIGIILSVLNGGFQTIEGNSNTDGSANGTSVVSIARILTGKQFIRLES